MRIALYKDTLANNRGADRAVRNLAAGLVERGHEAVLFEKPELMVRLRERWDVIISTGTNELLDLVAAGRRLPPVIQQFHTDPAYQFRHWLRRWRRNRAIKAALTSVSAIQVLRRQQVKWLCENVGRLESTVHMAVIGNWSDIAPVSGRNGDPDKVVIYPGAINRDKNQELLIRSFVIVRDDFPEWRLEFYGTGSPDNERRIRNIAERSRNDGRISFKGHCELREAYARCAFVALPSKTEGFSLVIAEAASFGKPTVMVQDWIGTVAAGGGIVTEPSARAYAEGLRRLMSDMPLCRQMGEIAQRFCAECYSRAKILDQWESLLENVVK